MNTRFSCLKRYRVENVDPAENHATESLGACLTFSERFLESFLKMLFGKAPKRSLASVKVETQVSTQTGGILDLVLTSDLVGTAVIEVKVNAPLSIEQLQKYWRWLEGRPNPSLFTLVKNSVSGFPFEHCKVKRSINWSDVARAANEASLASSGTERRLLADFYEYLQEQGITRNITLKELRKKDSTRAKAFFSELADTLEAASFSASRPQLRARSWPKIMVGKQHWALSFPYGNHQRVSLWLTWPGIWEAEDYYVALELEVWHRGMDSDWDTARSTVFSNVERLKESGFDYFVYRDRAWNVKERNLPLAEIKEAPQRIVAVCKKVTDVEVPRSEDLVATLFPTILKRVSILESLLPNNVKSCRDSAVRKLVNLAPRSL